MITIILFIGGTAIVGSLGYLAIRPLVMEHWDRWQMDREHTYSRQLRERRQKMLRDEATLSVLTQIAQQEEARQRAGRKAA